MRAVAFFAICVACACHARRVNTGEQEKPRDEQQNALESLSRLLLANKPTAAFTPSGPGMRLPADKSGSAPRPVMQEGGFVMEEQAGVTAPMGFFDPMGFSSDPEATEGKLRFYREVELKHCRLAMIAALGFLVGEQFHPLFGGDIDVPSYLAFQQTPLQTFWPIVVTIISILEVFSVFSFNSPLGGQPWSIRSDHVPGDLGFDPLSLKPEDPEELKTMQTKELNNGRLAMFGIAGMVAQELVTGQKLF